MSTEKKERTGWRAFTERYISLLEAGNQKTYWIFFGIMFAIMFLCMTASLAILGKSFIWRDDGLTQQYTSFIMLGEWYRSLFENFFVNHSFAIPMWTEIVGYGEDIILSISNYIGNPFFLTAAFADAHNADFFLDLSVFMTLLTGGVTFTFLVKHRWHNGFAVLVGCMVYVFSGFSLIAFSQIHMLYPLALAPLIFLGADKIFEGERPILFIISLALMMLNSMYMGYVTCLLLLVFCLVRFFVLPKKSWRLFGKLLIIFIASIAISIAVAGVLFVPSAISLLSQTRIGLERDSSLPYSLAYYLQVYEGFLKYEYVGSECFIGFSPIALIALLYLFASKRDRMKTFLVASFCALSIVLLLPFLGSLFNGFAYPNNRWIWAYSLLIGIITVHSVSLLGAVDVRRNKIFVILMLAYALVAALYMARAGKAFGFAVVIAMILFATLLWKGGRSCPWKAVVCSSLVLCCAASYVFWLFPGFGNAASRNVDAGDAYDEAVIESSNSIALELPEGEWRYDAIGPATTWRNTGVATGRNSVSFYNSMYNDAIDEYHSALGLTTSPFSISFESMDARLAMEQMAGVKYVIANRGSEQVPLLYSKEAASETIDGNEYAAYESDHVLPLAFVYDADDVTNTSSLDQLNAIEMQDSFLESIFIDRETQDRIAMDERICDVVDFSMTMQQNNPKRDNVQEGQGEPTPLSESEVESFQDGDQVQAKNGGITATLHANIPAGKKAYLCVKGLKYEPTTLLESLADTERDTISAMGRLKLQIKQFLDGTSSGCNIAASTSVGAKAVWQPSNSAHLYGGKDSWAFNLGVSDEDRDWVKLDLSTPGFYSVENLEIVLEDEQLVADEIVALEEKGADDMRFEGNVLSCNAEAASDGDMLFFRLPYSNGWHATVDGENAEIVRANIGFMAVKLPKGDHQVSLTYETPGFAIGSALSVCSIAGMVIFVLATRASRKRKRTRASKIQQQASGRI